MKIDTTNRGRHLIVAISAVPKGQLDMSNVKLLKKNFPALEGDVSVVFDFEKITYIDSSVIGYLVEVLNERRNAGATVGFINLNDKIRNILDLANLTRFFRIFSSPDEIPG
jgi:anti-anti-sigma factor